MDDPLVVVEYLVVDDLLIVVEASTVIKSLTGGSSVRISVERYIISKKT